MSSYFFMKIFLDTADVSMISPAYETGLLDGVTTNPTLILKSGRQLQEVIEEISNSFSIIFNFNKSSKLFQNCNYALKRTFNFIKVKNQKL